MVTVQNIKVSRQDYSGRVVSSTDQVLISENEITSCKDKLRRAKKQSSIPENTKVYFSGTATFPRRKFSELFKNNKLSTLANADVVVMDIKDTERRLNRMYTWQYVKQTDGTYMEYWRNPSGAVIVEKYHPSPGPTELKLLNELDSLPGKILVDLKDVSLPSEERLDREAYERISKMLNATDTNMVSMGLRLLSAYNYEEEKKSISLILGVNWPNASMGKLDSVEIKSMLRKLDMDFDSWRQWYYKPISFWMKEVITHPGNYMLEEILNMAIRKEWKDAPRLKITRDEG